MARQRKMTPTDISDISAEMNRPNSPDSKRIAESSAGVKIRYRIYGCGTLSCQGG